LRNGYPEANHVKTTARGDCLTHVRE
jgi:hypothetical protein